MTSLCAAYNETKNRETQALALKHLGKSVHLFYTDLPTHTHRIRELKSNDEEGEKNKGSWAQEFQEEDNSEKKTNPRWELEEVMTLVEQTRSHSVRKLRKQCVQVNTFRL